MKKKTKRIIILGLEKPKCCNDCMFHTSEMSPVRNKFGFYKLIINCKLIPDDEEDGWHDFNWGETNIQEWCPIREANLTLKEDE